MTDRERIRNLLANFAESHARIERQLDSYGVYTDQAVEFNCVTHQKFALRCKDRAVQLAKEHLRRTENLIWELETIN